MTNLMAPRQHEEVRKRWSICKWTTLRASGEAKILKVSYITLALIPIAAKYSEKLSIIGFPFYLKASFFASLFISMANVIYAIFCPKLLKRFDSPNDMYLANLSIYEYRYKAKVIDTFVGEYSHCIKGFIQSNYSAYLARGVCFVCLVLGGLSVIMLILERSWWVISAT